MVGLSEIYDAFASGALENDADVAQAHGPAEMDFIPLSEPLVNVRATISRCLQCSQIASAEHDQLQAAAKGIFFKDRTYRRPACAVSDSGCRSRRRGAGTLACQQRQLETGRRTVACRNRDTPDSRFNPEFSWPFEATSVWNAMFPVARPESYHLRQLSIDPGDVTLFA
ncbi:TfuA-like protein [Rhizobium sp. L43]|uniref:TfuA-like protein n=1 Tax=Rhizobium sp. L43 TaxID=2035452 RepID=UPI00117B2BC6|nr:TfuA-like protein [Rhizobium sp. L43]